MSNGKVKTEDYIREFLYIIFIKLKIVVYVAITVFVAALFVAFVWPPTYSSEAKILVKHKKLMKSPEMLEKISISQPTVTESDVVSEMEIVTSVNIIEMTIQELQKNNKIFRKNLSPLEFRNLVRTIKENMKTETTPKSDVFKITLYWNNPIDAETILSTHLDTYMKYRLEIYAPTEAEVFFQDQVKAFDKKLKELESQLLDLATKSQSPVPDEKIRTNLLIQQNLESDLNKMMNSYVEKKRYVRYIQDVLKSHEVNCFTFIESPTIGDFGKKLQDLLVEKERIRRVYADQSTPVLNINEQIQNTAKALKAEVQRYVEGEIAKLKAMEEAIESMSNRLNRIKEDNVRLYQNSIKSKAIERELKLAEESFSTFVKRWDEAKIDRSSSASNLFTVSIISDAKANLTPVFPQKRIVIPVGFLLALILGITAGFLAEFFDHTFKRPEDVKRFAGVETIFSIPEI